ncbi:MAG: gliding motility lipoprotein GldH [Bergeyella sp.]|nr:gliding motility lipoprotein GldH [Bergeyella sp.]
MTRFGNYYFFLFLFFSCAHEDIQMKDMEGEWSRNPVVFSFDISQETKPKNIIFVVRNNNDYPYSNLRLFVSMYNEGKRFGGVDTLNYVLADPDGRWRGSGFGDTKETRFLYKENFKFLQRGTYKIYVTQAMREKCLVGIEDLGIVIQETD